ncbi:MAG: hypothetical protein U0X39_02555 [Bacteroidales bacterium]
MNTREIQDLLDKYYRGETNENEEKQISNFLMSEDLPEELEDEKEIFRYYGSRRAIPEPAPDFENRIIKGLDKSGKALYNRKIYSIISIAASVMLLVGSYFFIGSRENEPEDTFTDPQLAYTETMRILHGVSSKLNTGISELEQVRKIGKHASKSIATLSKSTAMIDRNLENYQYFQKAMLMIYSPLEIGNAKKKN